MSVISDKYDNVLFEILQNEGQITPFLDAIFSFLYRRTDYYKLQELEKNHALGFPDGVAENILRQVFMKYYKKARDDDKVREEIGVPEAVCEEIIGDKPPSKEDNRNRSKVTHKNISQDTQCDEDCYNGANMGSYKWSQTLTEVDIRVQVSQGVVSGKNVKVQVRPDHLDVSVFEQTESRWNTLVSGQFPHRVNTEDAIWTLIPGDHVHISLEKREERLWEFLLEGEPKLDTRTLDNTFPMESLDGSSHAVVEELVYNQQQKMMGKLTSKEQKVEKILKEAWDLDGSPFKGQPLLKSSERKRLLECFYASNNASELAIAPQWLTYK